MLRSGTPARLATVLVAAALMGFAPAGQPDPKRKPNILNPDIDFAMKEMCFPWVKGEASVEALTDRQGVVAASKSAWPGPGQAWWVGRPVLTVVLDETARGSRSCTLRMTGGDPVKLRAELDRALGGWRVPLTASVHRFPPGAYARREVLCGPREGPQDAVLISTGAQRAPVPMMVTLMTVAQRDGRCDAQQ